MVPGGWGEAGLQNCKQAEICTHGGEGKLTVGWRGGSGEITGGKQFEDLTKHFQICEW